MRDLKAYERAKFELAEIVRAAAALAKDAMPEGDDRLPELLVRLAEDRFNLVVVGRFSRGKTSLMNAILGSNRLPIGIVPLTSVITIVTYGSKERLLIHYDDRRLSSEVAVDALPEYVTQRHNPGNVLRVSTAEVQLPAEILRRGFHFIDTPGLGSPILESTRLTEGFLSQADAFVLVTSYESPLSEEEARVLRVASSSARRTFVVLNKHDTVSAQERDEALHYVRERLADWLGDVTPSVFSVSARDGLDAKLARDAARLAASGIADFEAELARFLLEDKRTEFLLRLCDRTRDALRDLPAGVDTDGLIERIRELSEHIVEAQPRSALRSEKALSFLPESVAPGSFGRCEICEHILQASFAYLSRYQYDLSVHRDVQDQHAARGGFCPPHTWRYAALAAPRDVCTAYPALLDRLARELRDCALADQSPVSAASAIDPLEPNEESCALCRVSAKAEAEAMAAIAGSFRADPEQALSTRSALCLPHLRLLIATLGDAVPVGRLLEREASILERLSEDMQRYATKVDALRRSLASDEEAESAQRALYVVAGLRHVHIGSRGTGPRHRSTQQTTGAGERLHGEGRTP